MSKVAVKGNPLGSGTFTIESPNSNTDRTFSLPDASGTVITSGSTTGINASALSTGTVAAARLGSGTPGTGNFLRGDGSWQAVPASAPSTTDVLNATAGASVGAVGTYAFLGSSVFTTTEAGGTIAGSNLRYAGVASTSGNTYTVNNPGIRGAGNGGTPAGTWRAMGRALGINNDQAGATLFLRIS